MIVQMLAAHLLLGGAGCQVSVLHTPYVAQSYVAHTPAKIYYGDAYANHHQSYDYNTQLYPTLSAFVYPVEDPDKAALRRENEVLVKLAADQAKSSEERLKRYEAKLDAAAAAPPVDGIPPGAASAPARPSAESILQAKCMACHQAGKAKGDFVLPKEFTLESRLLIGSVIGEGEMPPKSQPADKQLTPEEKEILKAFLSVDRPGLKKALAAGRLPEKKSP
jgi:mono/diheme cytochrome c family protein